jgi:16S rRNA (uracil1498-N3)-methyltransferase
MQRFFLLDQKIEPAHRVDLQAIRHQLVRVLRAQPGERIVLLDGSGGEFVAELRQVDRQGVWADIVEQRNAAAEPQLCLTLYPCALKADKLEWVLQKGTELGVSRFVPVISQRTVARPVGDLAKKLTRWQAIVREAAEQCGRARLPELTPPLAWQEAVAQANGPRVVLWEEAAADCAGLAAWAAGQRDHARAASLLIGPEGGLTAGEVLLAQAHGWQAATLGRRILRAETAAIAAVAIIMAQWGELGAIG